ncbi:MAG: aspartate carbamoyltransferase regulatory subunit [Clostridiales Family XIII bacterium]|jgi:aspartate carbamoyltransferase regulatory subunit|nr:aspartate carbamoyltransferase regulatory subunit [Clostridiales Family XIII bacterium]
MEVNEIENGIVIDHIKAGTGLKALSYLGIDTRTDTVALIMNAQSSKHGRKDIIKIENLLDIDLASLGLLDCGATVNYIEGGELVKKVKLALPERVTDVIKCKNPRCVTSVEPAIQHVFLLVDPETEEYRCEYCDETVRF